MSSEVKEVKPKVVAPHWTELQTFNRKNKQLYSLIFVNLQNFGLLEF